MRMWRFWRGLATVALAGCMVGAVTTIPAEAASNTGTYTVTIGAYSILPKVKGDTWVIYNASERYGKAWIYGMVTGLQCGDVITLETEPFGSTTFSPTGTPVTPDCVPPVTYSFPVKPGLATTYEVQVTTGTTVDVTSTPVTVYVVPNWSGRFRNCRRPVCHERFHAVIRVPKSALQQEIRKRWYFYFGLKLSRVNEPSPPKYLRLDKHVKITKPKRLSASVFTRTFTWSFRIGNDGYDFAFKICSKATESKDGLGLPGHHGCGARRIRNVIAPVGGPAVPVSGDPYRSRQASRAG